MGKSLWKPLRTIERHQLTQARLAAHYAVQWLARAARAYIEPKADDSHTNLGWDRMLGGVVTHPLPDGSRLALRISDLTLLLSGPHASELSLKNRSDVDIRAWLGPRLSTKGLDPFALDKQLPYDMPASPIAGGGRYLPDDLESALGELSGRYDNASRALDDMRQQLVARGLRAPPVRCWPHHFDLDMLIYFSTRNSVNTRTMGVGFSPGDEYYDEPYFYVSIYPAPLVTTLPALPVGHWHSHHFTAAIATAGSILDESDQGAAVGSFLRSATDIISALNMQAAE
jgi:hypothetical protein